jgi:hypothetical protein
VQIPERYKWRVQCSATRHCGEGRTTAARENRLHAQREVVALFVKLKSLLCVQLPDPVFVGICATKEAPDDGDAIALVWHRQHDNQSGALSPRCTPHLPWRTTRLITRELAGYCPLRCWKTGHTSARQPTTVKLSRDKTINHHHAVAGH